MLTLDRVLNINSKRNLRAQKVTRDSIILLGLHVSVGVQTSPNCDHRRTNIFNKVPMNRLICTCNVLVVAETIRSTPIEH